MEQCIEYELPRTPIKESEHRAANFEAQFGTGATELDALQALHPGALREILVEHIERYYDHDLNRSVENAVDRFTDELDSATSMVRDIHSDEIAALDEQRNTIARAFEQVHVPAHAAYREAVALAHDAYTAAIEQARDEIMELEQRFIDEAEPLIEAMATDLAEFAPDPELFDWPEPDEADEDDDDPLYDSTRPYVEQVDRFREHQGKDADVRLSRDRVITKTCLASDCTNVFETTATKQKFCSSVCARRHSRRELHAARGKATAKN
jgi:hypothetical protein